LTQLNQIIAIEKGVKVRAEREFTDAHHTLEKSALLSGIARTYTPRDDEGLTYPPESTPVQVQASEMVKSVAASLTRLFDVELTKDIANEKATASIVVDGKTIVPDVPVTFLLFLEKKLTDIRTFVAKLPTLDPSERWNPDPATGVWVTDEVGKTKSDKVPASYTKSPATVQHPAQVEFFYKDVVVGAWSTRKFSGALPQERVTTLLRRVDMLIDAVKFAREQANSIEVADRFAGKKIFDYLLAE
jgi:hypothetical protein